MQVTFSRVAGVWGLGSVRLLGWALGWGCLAGGFPHLEPLSAQELPPPRLEIDTSPQPAWIRISAEGPTNTAYHLEASTNYMDWTEVGLTLDSLHRFPDPASASLFHRVYRAWISSKTSNHDWKNQIHFPVDPFATYDPGYLPDSIQWIKFAVLLQEPHRVYYQDSRKFLFHYDFATQRLSPFLGMTSLEFDQVSLHTNGQQVLLGTVLFPPPGHTGELGIQLVGLDPYPLDTLLRALELVRATVVTAAGERVFYMPTYEQAATAEAYRSDLARIGMELGSTTRWLSGDQCYSQGWALGRLRYVSSDEIDIAYAEGRLAPGDILLTDGVPAEIPPVAGVITLTPATPNSHVAILAQSFGIPFAHVVDTEEQTEVLAMAGRRVAFRVRNSYQGCEVRVLDVEDILTPPLEEEILELKQPPELAIPAKTRRSAYTASAVDLTPADTRYFGGKAANFGFLRREIPDHCPDAIAFSFDLWDDFLEQPLTNGMTLGAAIEERLAPHAYPPDMPALRADLAAVRDLIRNAASFPPALQMVVTNALVGRFDPSRKIRFRSSTNVEDTEQFVGAGLYDSYSGCLLDDLDGDTAGPSGCDPAEENERGVFRALQRVFASFYNDNAFLERLRHGLDENTVGMAVLVHHSFPDAEEWANGVAKLDTTVSGLNLQMIGDLVTQDGPVPVTNPEGGALPEVISVYRYGTSTYLNLTQRSSLVPLGDYVMAWEGDYRQFMELFAAVARGYKGAFPAQPRFLLDFEYKKMAPGNLVVKQVRQLPYPDTTTMTTSFLLHATNQFCVFQGEAADVFSNHRLKSLWRFTTKSLRLAETNLASGFYTHLNLEFLEGGQIATLDGDPRVWDEASHSVSGNYVTNSWSQGSGKEQRRFHLITELTREVPVAQDPLLTLADFTLFAEVVHATPLPALDWEGRPILVTNEIVRLVPCPVPSEARLLQTRHVTNQGVAIEIVFYWPEEPTGVVAGYTAPLVKWDHTTLTGLISQPITLRGQYSQTYRPGHHNFTEEFIFEPRLEPGLDPALLQELEASNIQLLHVLLGWQGDPVQILGLDGRFRDLPAAP